VKNGVEDGVGVEASVSVVFFLILNVLGLGCIKTEVVIKRYGFG